jgi:hypothetical protein
VTANQFVAAAKGAPWAPFCFALQDAESSVESGFLSIVGTQMQRAEAPLEDMRAASPSAAEAAAEVFFL